MSAARDRNPLDFLKSPNWIAAKVGPLRAWTCAGKCIEGRYSERTDRRRRAASSSSPCTTYTTDQEPRSRPGMPRLIDLSDPVPCAPFLPTALKLVNARRVVREARRGREASQRQGLHSKITHGRAVLPGPSSNLGTNAVVLSPGRTRETRVRIARTGGAIRRCVNGVASLYSE